MEENSENTEGQGQRVTRARTRRMSLLDTDSRPGTPQLDTASDRGTASPRPTRRTRLNSVTLDVRTPTRSTRASLARGETPEPTTPSSTVKRTARTPAKTKSVRQQLTLKEEEAEEIDVEKQRSRTNTPTGEKRVTRSMSQTPPSVTRPSSQPDLNTFPEDKPKRELESVKNPQVVEKEVKAPPVSTKTPKPIPKVSVRLEKLKMDEPVRDDISLAEEMKEKRVLAEEIKEKTGAASVNPKDGINLAEEMKEKRRSSVIPKDGINLAEEMKEKRRASLNPKDGISLAEEIKEKTRATPVKPIDVIVLAEEVKEKRGSTPVKPLVVEVPNNDIKQSVPTLDSEKSQPVPSIKNESKEPEPVTVVDSPEPAKNTGEKQPTTAPMPLQLPEQNDSLEEQEFLDAEESLPEDVLQQEELVSEMAQDSKVEQQILPKSNIAEPEEEFICEESPPRKEATIKTPEKELIASPEKEIKSPEIPMDVDEDIQVPDKENSVIISSPKRDVVDINTRGEQKKVVGFFNDTKETDEEKKRFPKTPGREKVPSSFILTPKPLKTDMEQRRNSSTPLLKGQESKLGFDKMELQAPPLQIDAIKPYGELEKEQEFSLVQPENVSPKKAVNEILALLNSDEEPEEVGAEDEEEDGDECEFIANEAEEAPSHYQSGDSMDSSERREIEENEIHCDGESVGSQDTEEESDDDSNESNDSFVVPDDDEEEEEEEEELDPLCYSTNEEEAEEEVEYLETKDKKKRRRILVAESSDDENQEKEQNKSKRAKSKDQSNCSSNASKLSEAAQMMNGSAEKFSNSETELENSRIMALKELNKSERFNKTATRQDASVLELESTDQEDEEEEEAQAKKKNESVFEIMDSDEDKSPDAEGKDEDEELESEKPEDKEPAEETAEEEPAEEEPAEEEPAEEEPAEEEPAEEEPAEEKTVEKSTQKPSKSADEEALAELASSDLRHLETMFNPLQKSRRQSLIMPSHELTAKEPKLKRRSDRAVVGSDFCPSQSFVEMIAEQKRIKNKRKRLSKSFSCGAEDLEEMEGILHERKRSKVESKESLEDDDDDLNAETAPVELDAEKETSGPDSLQESDSEEEPMQTETITKATPNKEVKNVEKRYSLKKTPAKETLLDNSHSKEECKPTCEPPKHKTNIPKVTVVTEELKPSSEPKTAEYYLEYCNSVLQKANEAFRKKKKEDVAAGKRQKKQKRPIASAVGKSEQAMPTLQTGKQTSNPSLAMPTFQAPKQVSKPPPPQPKKDLKRLQAARQAVGHAVNLLAPTKIAEKEPRSLARKLSPQPPQKDKKEKEKSIKVQKPKPTETSPLKSSDEENHVVRGNRFRTNAGIVTVSMIDSPPRAPIIELIKTSSGIMRVEPVTPKQKYFRELPATPKNHGFQERPSSSGNSKKRGKQKALQATANSAMQSALRFKEQAFARKF